MEKGAYVLLASPAPGTRSNITPVSLVLDKPANINREASFLEAIPRPKRRFML
jgi:hypothetical protein